MLFFLPDSCGLCSSLTFSPVDCDFLFRPLMRARFKHSVCEPAIPLVCQKLGRIGGLTSQAIVTSPWKEPGVVWGSWCSKHHSPPSSLCGMIAVYLLIWMKMYLLHLLCCMIKVIWGFFLMCLHCVLGGNYEKAIYTNPVFFAGWIFMQIWVEFLRLSECFLCNVILWLCFIYSGVCVCGLHGDIGVFQTTACMYLWEQGKRAIWVYIRTILTVLVPFVMVSGR